MDHAAAREAVNALESFTANHSEVVATFEGELLDEYLKLKVRAKRARGDAEAASRVRAFVAQHPEVVALYEESELIDQYLQLKLEAMKAGRILRTRKEGD